MARYRVFFGVCHKDHHPDPLAESPGYEVEADTEAEAARLAEDKWHLAGKPWQRRFYADTLTEQQVTALLPESGLLSTRFEELP